MTTHIERNVSEYDKQAQDFSAEEAFASDQRTKVRTLIRIIGALEPRREVAEVGSFTGYAAAQYAGVSGVERMQCFDLSPAAVERCRGRGLQADVWNADGQRCPAKDASLDVVVAADVIEHLVNTDGFLSELHRILRPGGHLVVSTPNLAFWLSRLRLLLGRVPWSYPGVSSTVSVDRAIDLNHLRINTHTEWTNLIERSGFEILATETYSLLDDQPRTLKNRALLAVDRVLRRNASFAFGHIFVARKLG